MIIIYQFHHRYCPTRKRTWTFLHSGQQRTTGTLLSLLFFRVCIFRMEKRTVRIKIVDVWSQKSCTIHQKDVLQRQVTRGNRRRLFIIKRIFKCCACCKGRDDLSTEERLEEVKFGVSQLPPAHFHTLKYLMSHLHRCAIYLCAVRVSCNDQRVQKLKKNK